MSGGDRKSFVCVSEIRFTTVTAVAVVVSFERKSERERERDSEDGDYYYKQMCRIV